MNKKRLYGGLAFAWLATACGAEPIEAVDQTTQPLLGAWSEPIYPSGGGRWSAIVSRGTPALSGWPGVGAACGPGCSPPTEIDVFTRDYPPNKALRAWYTPSGGWQGGQRRGDTTFSGSLAAVSWSKGRHDMIGIGFVPTSMRHTWSDDGINWGWDDLGGDFMSGSQVAISSRSAGKLDVFGQNWNQLFYKSFDGVWGDHWLPLGGSLAYRGLASVSTWAGAVNVFAVFTDGQVYTTKFLDGAWSNWLSIGIPPGGLGSKSTPGFNALAASQVGVNAVVFAYDLLGNIYMRTEPYTTGWTIIDNQKNTMIGSLAAFRRISGIDLFAIGFASGDGGSLVQNRLSSL